MIKVRSETYVRALKYDKSTKWFIVLENQHFMESKVKVITKILKLGFPMRFIGHNIHESTNKLSIFLIRRLIDLKKIISKMLRIDCFLLLIKYD